MDEAASGREREAARFDASAGDYSRQIETALGGIAGDHAFFVRHKAALLLDLLGRSAGGARLLDVGCGIGLLHPHLRDRVAWLGGTDISATSLAQAAGANPGVDYRPSSGGRLPFDDASVDLASLICVLHHVPPAERATLLAEVRRVLRPGGRVAIVEHNPWNPATQWVVLRCPLDEDARLLRPGVTRRLLRAAGCLPAPTRHLLFTPFQARPFRRLDAALGWLPLGAQYLAVGRRPA